MRDRPSSNALAGLGIVWDDDGRPDGFQVGKSAALLDWQHRKEERAFEQLVKRLRWNRWQKAKWASLSADEKRRWYAYRRAWAKKNPERYASIMKRAKAKFRSDPKKHASELAQKRARRAAQTQARREVTVYQCTVCGSQWSPLGRLPAHPPHYCSTACKSRAQWMRGKALK